MRKVSMATLTMPFLTVTTLVLLFCVQPVAANPPMIIELRQWGCNAHVWGYFKHYGETANSFDITCVCTEGKLIHFTPLKWPLTGMHIWWEVDLDKDGDWDTTGETQIDMMTLPFQYTIPDIPSPDVVYIEVDFDPSIVGGFWVPADKSGLLAPYIGLASTIIVATAITAIYVKRRKKKQ